MVSEESGVPSGSDTQMRPRMLPMFVEMAFDAGIPWGCYQLSMTYLSHSEVVALLVASIFPALKSLYGLLRRREFDPVNVLILSGLLFGLAALWVGGSARLLLVRESLFTGAFGLACLVSLLLPSRRPLMFFFGRFFAAGRDPVRRAWFDQSWQYPSARRAHRRITLVWGLLFVGEFSFRVLLIYTVSPATVLAVSPIVLGTATLLMVLWTFAYAARSRKAGAAARKAGAVASD